LFYARPAMVPKSNRMVVGLPPRRTSQACVSSFSQFGVFPSDALNFIKPAYIRTPSAYVDFRAQFTAARKLSKYVFPRQYGLAHPFNPAKGPAHQLPDYTDRELEIESLGPCRTPKRLREALCLLEKLAWRHGKCRYLPLRDKVCPSKVGCLTT
ncbi:hypothetical protein HDZ31DRAFT_50624, partial [Schizophyllum fasciatum]